MSPLYTLLRKNEKFRWSDRCQKVYETMIAKITSDQVLVDFNPKIPIVLASHASSNAIAGILTHKISSKGVRPIAFFSRTSSKSEKNYRTLANKSFAIIFSVTKLQQYLLGNTCTLRTDHKPMLSIFGEHKGLPVMAAARMQRWAFILSGFINKIEYIKGSLNEANNLSRIPHIDHNVDESEKLFVFHIKINSALNIEFKDVAHETRRNPVLSKVCDAVQQGTLQTL